MKKRLLAAILLLLFPSLIAEEAEKMPDKQAVEIVYTNWRGSRNIRRIVPKRILYTQTKWHPEEQWMLEAYDLDRKADRLFTMKDINVWLGYLPEESETTGAASR